MNCRTYICSISTVSTVKEIQFKIDEAQCARACMCVACVCIVRP